MDAITLALVSNPIYYVGLALACVGGFGFLLFMAGFLGGLPNIFHMHGHEGHIGHARVRVVQGLLIMMAAFGFWQIIRVILGETPPSTLFLALLVLIPVWYPWLSGILTGKSGH